MAEFLTRIASASVAAANTDETIYTVPADKAVVLSSIVVCNTDSSGIAFKIAMVSDDTTPPNQSDYLFSGVALAANTTVTYTLGITLSEGYRIHIEDDSARVAYNFFGSIIDQKIP